MDDCLLRSGGDFADVPIGLLARRAIRFLDEHTAALSPSVTVQRLEQVWRVAGLS
jgi:hypothetical protein